MSSNPLSFWWELARLPLSGDVDQRFLGSFLSPSLTVNYGGNAEIERRVVSDVASFGRQIGWLSEIVDRLADGERPPEDALRKLREAMEQIAAIKEQMRQSAQIEAGDAVDRLAKQDPEALREFLQRRLEDLAQARPPGKGRSRRR
jgi:exonuclease VII small subunit